MCHIVKRQLDILLILGIFGAGIGRGIYRSYRSIVIPILVAALAAIQSIHIILIYILYLKTIKRYLKDNLTYKHLRALC
jgi:hypothetical protein